MSKPTSNHCPVCTAPIDMDKLMCKADWRRVSLTTQRRLQDAAAWLQAMTPEAPFRARGNAAPESALQPAHAPPPLASAA